MSNEVRAGRRPGTDRAPTRAEKRKAWKEAAEKAAAARRRRQIVLSVIAGVVALALVGWVVFVVVGNIMDDDDTSTAGDQPSASAPAADGFPPLPAGADEALRTKPAAAAGSGALTELKVTKLITGAGPVTAAGQQITVNYVGVSWTTGKEFDSSWSRSDPFAFELGAGGVIQGWDQGLVGIPVGSRVQLDIPSDLAYGDNGQVPGPLRFIVDVLAAA